MKSYRIKLFNASWELLEIVLVKADNLLDAHKKATRETKYSNWHYVV